jgi:uncharacterized protein
MIIIHDVNHHHTVPRLLAPLLLRAGKAAAVRIVTGARQAGKSTLVRLPEIAAGRVYHTLDDLDILERSRREPDALVRDSAPLTLDEVQRSPELLLAVKRAVDHLRVPGKYVLTGSANLLMMKRVSESLSGRAVYFTLWPMTRREQRGLGAPGVWGDLFDAKPTTWSDLLRSQSLGEEDWRLLAARGGFPTPALELRDAEDRELWFGGYTRTYLERDVREVTAVSSPVDFRRLMQAAALRLGALVNQTDLARDVGLSQATVHRHLDVLETSYQIVRLPPFSVNRTKRLIKTPKLYWVDTGLALHLSGETEPRGAHLENVVLADLLAWKSAIVDGPEVTYWRTASSEEVDFVVEWKRKLLPIEVKSTTRPTLDDIRHLRSFRKEYGARSLPGLLVHCGKDTTWLADDVLAVPWWRVL